MNGAKDISRLLKEWKYDDQNNVRFLTGADGRQIMQVRQPLGIEQYDLDGRPDGLQPEGEDTVLDFYRRKEREAGERGDELVLSDEDMYRLQQEGVLFYYRYLALFQVGAYERVARDTEHNLDIGRMLDEYCRSESRNEMLQYRPYILRMNAISRAMVLLAEDNSQLAAQVIEQGKETIESLTPVPTPIFEFERVRSLQHLSHVLSQIRSHEHRTPPERRGFRERLMDELSRAVESEDYEQAARLRDRIRRLD